MQSHDSSAFYYQNLNYENFFSAANVRSIFELCKYIYEKMLKMIFPHLAGATPPFSCCLWILFIGTRCLFETGRCLLLEKPPKRFIIDGNEKVTGYFSCCEEKKDYLCGDF